MPSRKRAATDSMAGYSMIELLITLVLIGVIAAIAISNLIGAHDKARQGATVADMRSIASAIETYVIDVGRLPDPAGDFTDLEAILTPYQASVVPTHDHWGNLYSYTRVDDDYTLISFGKDGVDGDDATPATRHEFHRDIVYSNGQFLAAPE